MLRKRFLFLCAFLSCFTSFYQTKTIQPEDCYLGVSVFGTTFGVPTVQFFSEHPDKAAASVVVSLIAGFIGYKLYKRHTVQNQEKIKSDFRKDLEHDIKKEYQRMLNIQIQKEREKFQQQKNNESEEMTKSHVRIFAPGQIKEKYEDVAGMEDAKEDLYDIIHYLKDSKAFDEIGAQVPTGILLSGPPGVGKTMLARATAGEVNCLFLHVDASQFVEMYVGRGAARVRDLFEVARENAPCILFIDEIDAIARKRSDGAGSGGDAEYAQTLNQLLAEMDGFEKQEKPVIVLAATNRAESLDPAIMRPGRFDKKVIVELPRFKDRKKILQVHLNKVKHEDIDVELIARGTPEFSGAELAQLVNEAALIALRSGDKAVEMKHLDESRDVIVLGGKESSSKMELTREDLWETAVHEAGHALMHVYESESSPLYKVTIRPRGSTLGTTHGMWDRDRHGMTREQFVARICVCLGGSVAEELSLNRRGTGILGDLQQAREVAKQMVMIYGLSDGFMDITFREYIGREYALPPELSDLLQKEIKRIIDECRVHTKKTIKDHLDQIHKVSEALMEKGTLYGSEVYEICGKEVRSLVYNFVDVP